MRFLDWMRAASEANPDHSTSELGDYYRETYGGPTEDDYREWESSAVERNPGAAPESLRAYFEETYGQAREISDVSNALADSWSETKATAAGAGGLLADTIGVDGLRDAGLESYNRNMADVQSRHRDQYDWDYLTENGTAGDWVDAVQYHANKGLASFATGFGVGVIVRGAAKYAVRKGVSNAVKKKAGTAGFYAGLGGQAMSQELGEVYGSAVDEAVRTGGTVDDVNLGKVWGYGTAAGAVEFAGDALTLGAARLAPGVKLDLLRTGSRKAVAAKTVGMGMATEGLEESAQNPLEYLGANKELGTDEFWREQRQSAFAGALGGLGGSAVSVPVNLLTRIDPNAPPPPPAAPAAPTDTTLALPTPPPPPAAPTAPTEQAENTYNQGDLFSFPGRKGVYAFLGMTGKNAARLVDTTSKKPTIVTVGLDVLSSLKRVDNVQEVEQAQAPAATTPTPPPAAPVTPAAAPAAAPTPTPPPTVTATPYTPPQPTTYSNEFRATRDPDSNTLMLASGDQEEHSALTQQLDAANVPYTVNDSIGALLVDPQHAGKVREALGLTGSQALSTYAPLVDRPTKVEDVASHTAHIESLIANAPEDTINAARTKKGGFSMAVMRANYAFSEIVASGADTDTMGDQIDEVVNKARNDKSNRAIIYLASAYKTQKGIDTKYAELHEALAQAGTPLTPQDITILERVTDGQAQAEVAKDLGINQSVVSRTLDKIKSVREQVKGSIDFKQNSADTPTAIDDLITETSHEVAGDLLSTPGTDRGKVEGNVIRALKEQLGIKQIPPSGIQRDGLFQRLHAEHEGTPLAGAVTRLETALANQRGSGVVTRDSSTDATIDAAADALIKESGGLYQEETPTQEAPARVTTTPTIDEASSYDGKPVHLYRGLKTGGAKVREGVGEFFTESKPVAEKYAATTEDAGTVTEEQFTPKRVFDVDAVAGWSKAKREALLKRFIQFQRKNNPTYKSDYSVDHATASNLYEVLRDGDTRTDFAHPQNEDVAFLLAEGYDSVRFEHEGVSDNKVQEKTWLILDRDTKKNTDLMQTLVANHRAAVESNEPVSLEIGASWDQAINRFAAKYNVSAGGLLFADLPSDVQKSIRGWITLNESPVSDAFVVEIAQSYNPEETTSGGRGKGESTEASRRSGGDSQQPSAHTRESQARPGTPSNGGESRKVHSTKREAGRRDEEPQKGRGDTRASSEANQDGRSEQGETGNPEVTTGGLLDDEEDGYTDLSSLQPEGEQLEVLEDLFAGALAIQPLEEITNSPMGTQEKLDALEDRLDSLTVALGAGVIDNTEYEKAYAETSDEIARIDAAEESRGGAITGATVDQVTRWLAPAMARLASWIDVQIVADVQALRQRPEMAGVRITDNTSGAVKKHRIYIVANRMTKAKAHITLAHEVVGHLGMRRVLGKKAMRQLYNRIRAMEEAGDKRITAIAKEVRQTYSGSDEDVISSEIVARIAEQNPNYGLVRWMIAQLRLGLAKLGIGNLDNAAIESILTRSAMATRSERRASMSASEPAAQFSLSPTAQATMDEMPGTAKTALKYTWEIAKTAASRLQYGFSFTENLTKTITKTVPALEEPITRFMRAMKLGDIARKRLDMKVASIMDKYLALEPEGGKTRAQIHDAVNEFLMESRRLAAWGYVPDWTDNPVDPATLDQTLVSLYDAMPTAAQEIVRAVHQHGYEMGKLKNKFVNQRIDRRFQDRIDSATTQEDKDAILEEKRDFLKKHGEFLAMLPGPYSPYKRFGAYIVKGYSETFADAMQRNDTKEMNKLRTDGEHYTLEFVDSQWEALRRRDELAKFYGSEERAEYWEKALWRDRSMVEFPEVDRLRALIQGSTDDKTKEGRRAQKKLEDLAEALSLSVLADHHSRQANRQAKGIHGADLNMMRSFAAQGRADAHYIANLMHLSETNDALREITATAETEQTGGVTRDQMVRMVNALYWHWHSELDYTPTPLQDRLAGVSSAWHLVFSPAYYIQNALQVGMMSVPYMTMQHDYGDVQGATLKAYKDIKGMVAESGWWNHMDTTKVPSDVSDAIQALVEDGTIDIFMDLELGKFAATGDSVMGKAARKFDQTFRRLPGRMETINRVVTAIAAIRLARSKNPNDEAAAQEYAREVIRMTHGNYNSFNTPKFISPKFIPGAKILFQFRKFQLIQAAYMATLFKQMTTGMKPGEKKAAARALMFTLAHAGIVAGARGLPFAGTFLFASSLLSGAFGDDDEPSDEESMLYRRRQDMMSLGFSQEATDIIMNGLPSLVGMEMTGKVGSQNILSVMPFVKFDPRERGNFEKVVTAASGPVIGGMMSRIWAGLGDFQRGDYVKAVERALPSGFGDAIQGVRLATRGEKFYNGDDAIRPEELSWFDPFLAGIGLTTEVQSKRWAKQRVKSAYESKYKQRTSDIKRAYNEAFKSSDRRRMSELRTDWVKLQTAKRKAGFRPAPLSDLRSSPLEQRKRERDRVGGVKFDRGNRQFVKSLDRAIGG